MNGKFSNESLEKCFKFSDGFEIITFSFECFYMKLTNDLKFAMLFALFLVFIMIDLIANILVILSVCFDKIRKRVDLCFMSNALADLLIGLIVMPFTAIYTLFGHFPLTESTCFIWNCLDFTAGTISMLHIAYISYDRYLSVSKPIKYTQKNSSDRFSVTGIPTVLTLAFIWFFSGAAWIPAILYVKSININVSSNLFNMKALNSSLHASLQSTKLENLPIVKEHILSDCNLEIPFYIVLPHSIIVYYLPMFLIVYFYTKTIFIVNEKIKRRSSNVITAKFSLVSNYSVANMPSQKSFVAQMDKDKNDMNAYFELNSNVQQDNKKSLKNNMRQEKTFLRKMRLSKVERKPSKTVSENNRIGEIEELNKMGDQRLMSLPQPKVVVFHCDSLSNIKSDEMSDQSVEEKDKNPNSHNLNNKTTNSHLPDSQRLSLSYQSTSSTQLFSSDKVNKTILTSIQIIDKQESDSIVVKRKSLKKIEIVTLSKDDKEERDLPRRWSFSLTDLNQMNLLSNKIQDCRKDLSKKKSTCSLNKQQSISQSKTLYENRSSFRNKNFRTTKSNRRDNKSFFSESNVELTSPEFETNLNRKGSINTDILSSNGILKKSSKNYARKTLSFIQDVNTNSKLIESEIDKSSLIIKKKSIEMNELSSIGQPASKFLMVNMIPKSKSMTNLQPKQQQSNFNSFFSSTISNKEKIVTYKLGIIMIAFIISWLPFCIMWPLVSYCKTCVSSELYVFSFWLAYMNSLFTPIILLYNNTKYRSCFSMLNTDCFSRKNAKARISNKCELRKKDTSFNSFAINSKYVRYKQSVIDDSFLKI
jgi:hypothetical protein